jgi:hypothetical protein
MANWPDLMFRARVFAANEPGFLANTFLELVALNGGPLGYSLNIGVNIATPEGRATADFHAALAIFCYQLRDLGVGHLPYHPAPNNGAGPILANAQWAPAGPDPPAADADFVEIVGGVHPIHGPWVVDHDCVEILGGIHPIHGPWVEGPGEQPANAGLNDLPDLGPGFNMDLLQPGEQPNQDAGGELPVLDFDFDLNLLP